MSEFEVTKDEDIQQPIPSIWRPIFCSIVKSFVERDYTISSGLEGLAPVTSEISTQIEEFIDDYGELLIELPDETWESSICMWMGNHWDVLIDLWTESEGRSDLVLSAQVTESENSYVVNVDMVYVP
ncbi:DUF7668 domain-containing protein [Vibrio diabolicus]|uniref:DUF7668 domain-containing protein n=1 Tax=Vibrio diabolicus TaxID=50719 RepID=UPI001594C971|nr:hypothetical protein [Vibrio diabolicus]NVC52812.1 hypothetical protein [Vibrio diabolicus]